MGLSYEEFNALFFKVKREALHMNMRDSYGTETELPHLAKWKAGEPDDFAWLQWWCHMMRDHVAAGRVFRRVNIASEPLSEYHQWSLEVEKPMVAAGQDIRWVSRRLVSELLFPGNDFWLFDDELVVFMHYHGSGLVADRVTSTDPADIQRCRDSFEAVWPLGVSHGEYRPTA
jgi:hypothetical protein